MAHPFSLARPSFRSLSSSFLVRLFSALSLRPSPQSLVPSPVLLLCAAALLLQSPRLLAGGGPENVALVVNGESWASLTVANEFIHLRHLPPDNVIYVGGLPELESLTVEQFRRQVLRPVLQVLEKRGLANQIDYVVYSADMPYAIEVGEDVKGQKLPQVLTTTAAVNGLTYLYGTVLARQPAAYFSDQINRYYRRPLVARADGQWTKDEQERYQGVMLHLQEFQKAREAAKKVAADAKKAADDAAKKAADDAAKAKDAAVPDPAAPAPAPAAAPAVVTPAAPPTPDPAMLADAVTTMTELRLRHPNNSGLLYNLACVLALQDHPDAAMAALTDADACGWWNVAQTEQDEDLAGLRARDDFKALVTRMKSPDFDTAPSRGFRNSVGWSAAGDPVAPNQGMRYLLSTVLSWTSGRGLSVTEALSQLQRSAAADGTRPSGTIYYLRNGDIRSTTREWAFPAAVKKLNTLGVRAEVLPGVLPTGKADVMGAMVGIADFNWETSKSTVLPGAIVEHFTSCGGMMHEWDGQTPLTAFLRAGAAGASGAVTEPYALQAKFPLAFMQVHYAHGCSLAESFYQSLTMPYQLLIVGDPLCQPWARPLRVGLNGLEDNELVTGTRALRPLLALGETRKVQYFDLFLNGHLVARVRPGMEFQLDTSKLPAGDFELRVVGVEASAVETQGSKTLHFHVPGSAALDVTGWPGFVRPWNWPITLHVRCPGAQGFTVEHNGRPLSSCTGEEGELVVDPRTLGEGPVWLQVAAQLPGTPPRLVVGRRIPLLVVAPPALAPSAPPADATLVPGLRLEVAGQPPVVLAKLEGDALAKAGVGPGTDYTLSTWINVPTQDVYQFQLHTNTAWSGLTVDGQLQDWPRGRAWSALPVPLQAGLHQVVLHGQGVAAPQLELRFGGPGSRRLAAPFARCVAVPAAAPAPVP